MTESLPSGPVDIGREDLLRTLADNVPALIAYYDSKTLRCVFANRRYAESTGWSVDDIVGRTVREIIGEEAWEMIESHVARMLRGDKVEYTRPLTLPSGEIRTIEVNLVPHFGDGVQVIGAFVLINDITRHQRAEQAIRDSEERISKFAAATTEGIFFHKDGILTDVNEALLDIVGYTRKELIGRNVLEFVPAEWQQAVSDHMNAGREDPYEAVVQHKDGHGFPVEVVVRTMRVNDETLRLGVLRDITTRKQAEERIHFLAHHDTLTGLPNRALLTQRLSNVLALARRHRTQIAIMFIDLDHFKNVNDSLGHHMGDVLLKQVAARIKALLRDADTVSRLGGDEFLVVLTDLAGPQNAANVADKLLKAIALPILLEGQPVCVNACIGISVFPRDGEQADDLIRHADTAMYRAKKSGRASARFFAPEPAAGEAH